MKYIKILLIVIIFIIAIFYDDLLEVKFIGNSIMGGIIDSINPTSNLKQKIYELEKEVENLRAKEELFKIEFSLSESDLEETKVYSSYPFNNKGGIAIAGGKNKGFKENNAVTFGDLVLVGKITEVFNSSSIVTTVFDPEWKIAVRIGENEIDGLFEGGNNPRVTLIEKNAEVKEGDFVLSASPELPYGLKIGTVKSIHEIVGEPFKEAGVNITVRLNELRNVSVYN